MLAPITTLLPHGTPGSWPPAGVVPVVGPVVEFAFVLALAGPPPNVIQPPVPQTCQAACPNVALRALLVDQAGAPLDLSAATGLQYWLLTPSQAMFPIPAAFVSNGLDGLIEALTGPDTLLQTGTWGIQAQLQFGATTMVSRWGYFAVAPNVVDF